MLNLDPQKISPGGPFLSILEVVKFGPMLVNKFPYVCTLSAAEMAAESSCKVSLANRNISISLLFSLAVLQSSCAS